MVAEDAASGDIARLAEGLVYALRGEPVMLDADIARLFGKKTGAVNQNRKRNAGRFLDDYAFQLSDAEWAELKSQFAISSAHGGRRTRPWAYTEQGFLMIAQSFRGPLADRIARVVAETFVAYRRGELVSGRVVEGPGAGTRRNSLAGQLQALLSGLMRLPMPTGNSVLEELQETTEKSAGRIKAWLDGPGLENAKLRAEVTALAAETQRAYAEIGKLDAETQNIWADTMLKRLEVMRQATAMVNQIERERLRAGLGAAFALDDDEGAVLLPGPDERS